ncbi:hypothetical protein HMPREF9946_03957 [Acetobacteraceae bacterium AT-5844]|nr:hypothetical protein HMPREF9946_03957 [Acetobacteraceae bacterium AT-5844]
MARQLSRPGYSGFPPSQKSGSGPLSGSAIFLVGRDEQIVAFLRASSRQFEADATGGSGDDDEAPLLRLHARNLL